MGDVACQDPMPNALINFPEVEKDASVSVRITTPVQPKLTHLIIVS
jgi:hypothetical protein